MHTNTMNRAKLHAALSTTLLILSAGLAGAAAQPPPAVAITDAWIRWLPANLPAGGYATLRNMGRAPVILTSASSSAYEDVSLHRTSSHEGMSQMQPVAQITVAAGASLKFAADGYHIMLEHPTKALQPGDHVPITLHFSDGNSITAQFELRRPDAAGPAP
jgi:periplasmic copper chaperone A